MLLQIIFVYCVCDEMLKAANHREDPQIKMYDAEIMTFAVTAPLFFSGNYERTRSFFLSHKYFRYVLWKSRLNKRLLRIPQETWIHILSVTLAYMIEKLESIL